MVKQDRPASKVSDSYTEQQRHITIVSILEQQAAKITQRDENTFKTVEWI